MNISLWINDVNSWTNQVYAAAIFDALVEQIRLESVIVILYEPVYFVL